MSLEKRLLESQIVVILLKQPQPPVGTVEDVIYHPPGATLAMRGMTGMLAHEGILVKGRVPFS